MIRKNEILTLSKNLMKWGFLWAQTKKINSEAESTGSETNKKTKKHGTKKGVPKLSTGESELIVLLSLRFSVYHYQISNCFFLDGLLFNRQIFPRAVCYVLVYLLAGKKGRLQSQCCGSLVWLNYFDLIMNCSRVFDLAQHRPTSR
jgi:hypothetical protein